MRADSQRRPRTAIELRNARVVVDFLARLENGARPCELVRPPFEDEKDAQIRLLKEELAKEKRKVAEFKNRRNLEADLRQEIREKDEIIANENQVKSKRKFSYFFYIF